MNNDIIIHFMINKVMEETEILSLWPAKV